jgi:proton-dependent oligopeptide transporter, POT family
MYNNLISQAGQMNLHGIPNDMIQAMAGVACVLFGPAIQALYSFLAKRRLPFGPIARITVAFFFCGGGMAYAAGIQKLIYATGPCYDRPLSCTASNNGKVDNDVNVWIQMPIYFILAVAEIFGFVTANEYAYSKAPRDMRTVIQALTQLTACLGSALGMAISPVAKDPHLIIMYACLAGTMALCAALFWWRFRKYDRIDVELNRLDIQEASSSDRNDAGM